MGGVLLSLRSTATGPPPPHLGLHDLCPSSVVVHVPHSSRNVGVPGLPYGLPVVHALHDGEKSGVFLEVASNCVNVAGSGVGGEGGPRLEGGTSRGNSVVDVVVRSLNGLSKDLTGGRRNGGCQGQVGLRVGSGSERSERGKGG